MENLINLQNCNVTSSSKILLKNISWQLNAGECWLVTGSNGGGKSHFINALAGSCNFTGSHFNSFEEKTIVVSLEEAAKLIQEERDRDESEYMDKLDIGRTGRQYICEVLGGSSKKNAPLPEIAKRLETMPQVKLCGVEKILDRGLKLMSTGEIRRTLLCRALLSSKKLIILSDPFAGLDVESRAILLEFFDTLSKKQLLKNQGDFPSIILCMERFAEIPESVNKVLEFNENKISFCGSKDDYIKIIDERNKNSLKEFENKKNEFLAELKKIQDASRYVRKPVSTFYDNIEETDALVKFEDVNVYYPATDEGDVEHKVLINMNWEVKKGVHWLIRGPNGSGKTTVLELITGDNVQVFREKVYILGLRRGSGESIWDIRKNLGIVSYRLHVEYRMVGGTSLENVIISGFKDSIGLYEIPTDYEIQTAHLWLKLGGFEGKEKLNFGDLSYGEQRAILILRAAVKSPKILILDEPCHGLDENFRLKILHLLELIASTGTTTLLHVTHEATEVLECEKNILELAPGYPPKIIRM